MRTNSQAAAGEAEKSVLLVVHSNSSLLTGLPSPVRVHARTHTHTHTHLAFQDTGAAQFEVRWTASDGSEDVFWVERDELWENHAEAVLSYEQSAGLVGAGPVAD